MIIAATTLTLLGIRTTPRVPLHSTVQITPHFHTFSSFIPPAHSNPESFITFSTPSLHSSPRSASSYHLHLVSSPLTSLCIIPYPFQSSILYHPDSSCSITVQVPCLTLVIESLTSCLLTHLALLFGSPISGFLQIPLALTTGANRRGPSSVSWLLCPSCAPQLRGNARVSRLLI